MKNYQALKELIAATEADAVKFYEKGNKASGTRLRKAMLQVKNIGQNVRAEVSNLKNQLK
ncbi:MAG: histone [Mucilaginibacter sp.]|nr:histone [Mucilaginibacter sp.]